jgi:NOL1/NOP2/sun family putative RNA methylase
MSRLLGDAYPAFVASYDAPPVVGLRVNTLKMSAEAFVAHSPLNLAPVPWCPAGFTVPETQAQAPGRHPWHAAGLYYLQEPSAMAVAELLDPQAGERVLDLAAAPGGKATHIAALMRGDGLLIANEIHPKRAWDLAENLERWGVRNAAITNESPERLAQRWAGYFDRVLLDAPCSGEGMFRKSEAARQEWSPALVLGCATRQSSILEHAARLVRPGGRLVYSTCTFAPEEDEDVIARFLEGHRDFDLIAPPALRGLSPEVSMSPLTPKSWGGSGSPRSRAAGGTTCVRLWPHTGPGEGHFIAVLARQAEDAHMKPPPPWRPERLPRAVEQAYQGFCQSNLTSLPDADRLALVGSYLYALSPDLPEPPEVARRGRGPVEPRFIHPGWWLGTVKKDRFEPSHALALGVSLADARRSVSHPADAPDLLAYLRGESFRVPGEDGWLLVAVNGFPIGWGKRVSGMVKSHYPKGLRRT